VLTGGSYVAANWKAVESGARPALPAGSGDWFLSLVPTQLQRLLGDAEAEEWLRGFRAVFVGGGPVWPELVEAGAEARLRDGERALGRGARLVVYSDRRVVGQPQAGAS